MVGCQIRFTLYRIDNHTFCLTARRRRKFHMGRETSTPHTYYTCILYLGYNFFRSQCTFLDQSGTAVNGFFPFISIHVNKDGRLAITARINYGVYLIYLTRYRREDGCRYKTTRLCNFGTYLYHITLLDDSCGRSTDVLRQREYRLLRKRKGFNGFAR